MFSQDASGRFALLYQLSQAFNSSLDLDQVLERVIDEVIAAIKAERGFVALRDDNGELTFRMARGMEQTVVDDRHAAAGSLRRDLGPGVPGCLCYSLLRDVFLMNDRREHSWHVARRITGDGTSSGIARSASRSTKL